MGARWYVELPWLGWRWSLVEGSWWASGCFRELLASWPGRSAGSWRCAELGRISALSWALLGYGWKSPIWGAPCLLFPSGLEVASPTRRSKGPRACLKATAPAGRAFWRALVPRRRCSSLSGKTARSLGSFSAWRLLPRRGRSLALFQSEYSPVTRGVPDVSAVLLFSPSSLLGLGCWGRFLCRPNAVTPCLHTIPLARVGTSHASGRRWGGESVLNVVALF